MLEVRDIWKSYQGKPLLQGLSMTVADEETVCLLGASGSGKSTLMRIIAGLELQERGSVLWNGRDISGTPVHKRGFGFMFQDYALFPHQTVAENVAFGLRMQGVSAASQAAKVAQALEMVEMQGFQNRQVTQLSGGEQQRVALARALAPEPKLLMLDEPLAALDRALREQLGKELRRILSHSSISAIYVTHDQNEAYQIADRVMLLHDGVVVQEGKPDAVYGTPASGWVAEFLGINNKLYGKVTSLSPMIVKTEQGNLRLQMAANKPLQPGDSVEVFIPENAVEPTMSLLNDNCLTGKVRSAVFRGDGYQIELGLAGGRVLQFRSDHTAMEGEQMIVHLDAEKLFYFTRDHD